MVANAAFICDVGYISSNLIGEWPIMVNKVNCVVFELFVCFVLEVEG